VLGANPREHYGVPRGVRRSRLYAELTQPSFYLITNPDGSGHCDCVPKSYFVSSQMTCTLARNENGCGCVCAT
jgi:hypothetical protein